MIELSSFKPNKKLRTKYVLYTIIILTLIWLFTNLMSIIITASDPVLDFPADWYTVLGISSVVVILLFVILVPLVYLYYNSIHYEVSENDVQVYRGLITNSHKMVPFRTITNLDVKRGPFDRMFGIGTIEIQTAGNSSSSGGPEEKIDGIEIEFIETVKTELRDQIRQAKGSAAVTHDEIDEMDETSILQSILYELQQLRKELTN